MKSQIMIALLLGIALNLAGQVDAKRHLHEHSHEHQHDKKFRVAGFIAHTLIKSEGSNSHLFIPSWGFDLDYWLTDKWGIGLHNDLEIETFIIVKPSGEEIERVNPLVLTLDGLYHLHNDLVFSAGPGVELTHGEPYYLFRLGVEWEKGIGNGVDISPTLFYDYRFDGFSTFTVGLGVGKSF